MNLFDGIQDAAFDVVTNTMGYDAVWEPSDGPVHVSGRVLFNDPSKGKEVGSTEYLPLNYFLEYKEGVFPGLKDAVDESKPEIIVVNGLSYNVTQVKTKYDGKTYIAILVPIT